MDKLRFTVLLVAAGSRYSSISQQLKRRLEISALPRREAPETMGQCQSRADG